MPSIPRDFDSLLLRLASPEKIRSWSYGEVTKAETINYRTGRAERGGLFDERIFGPTKDYECYCGKYRRIRYKNIVCEKCGVEVTRSLVRRERMGHIELANPVSHIWFLRNIPSRMGLLLNLSMAQVEKVIYFGGYIITEVNESERKQILKELDAEYKTKTKSVSTKKEREEIRDMRLKTREEILNIRVGGVLDGAAYQRYSLRYGSVFVAEIGAEAIYNMFKKLDLEKEIAKSEAELTSSSASSRNRLQRRVGLLKSMRASGIRPEWLFLSVIPIMPPGLRPMVPLDGGRHATSDINDLYRRVINRNNRLKKLQEVKAPAVILRNEKRILQEAVDALIDNAMRRGTSQTPIVSRRRELKSLAENLKGKQGFFRQNLLGKRVDYSGRSVIVVGPDLKLDQCGLPKHMALELFRPFVISKILERELAFNVRGAGRLIEEEFPEVWAILEEVIQGKYVLLNRAPTLHRLGIQAFRPVLIEGKAIELHPLVCSAFNADFDGDQMAVHVPLSNKAQEEARDIMASNRNILKPGSGDSTVSAKMLDILLGCYWATKIIPKGKGEGKVFSSPNIAITSYDFGAVDFRSRIRVLATKNLKYSAFKGGLFETSVGRLLFNSILPSDYPYQNEEINRKKLSKIIDELIVKYDIDRIGPILDKIKTFGFRYATQSGITWSLDDMRVPASKGEIIKAARDKAKEINEQYKEGLLSSEELYRKTVEIWRNVEINVEKAMPETLVEHGSVHDMLYSGARGQIGQLVQMAGVKGLITNTVGRVLSFPIVSSYKEGLSPLEYFITTHGARYGLTTTALQTAKSGYLTRKLVSVAQECIISEENCGGREGKTLHWKQDIEDTGALPEKVFGGRITVRDIVDKEGNVLITKKTMLAEAEVEIIKEHMIEEVSVYSPLSCKSLRGVCQRCYGIDLGRHDIVKLGEAVGIVSAQAIGEPGTQLTMRTFHLGGVAREDITMGLPRVEEVFERRIPRNPAIISKHIGKVTEVKEERREYTIVIIPEVKQSRSKKKDETVEYIVPFGRTPLVSAGDEVIKGDMLTDGPVDPSELFKYAGKEKTEDYLINEISKIYNLQGEAISRKHVEIIVRQMFSRMKIKDPGGTNFAHGKIVDKEWLESVNEEARNSKREEAKAEPVLLGITEAALNTESFLAAASFQNTTRILIQAALRGAKDRIRGLKENVIIGRLIPAGTGFKKEKKSNLPAGKE